ncbi:MAG: SH3 domain-containing protein [Cyanobacteriota bacterium]|nr:SH3 domain-containing protein [Cyanobacteriota bacterium]
MTVKMKPLPSVLQFIIGFLLGMGLFVGAITLVGYLIVSRFAATPERPVFPEEVAKKAKAEVSKPKASPKPDPKASQEPKPAVSPSPSPTPSPSPSPSPSPTLPPNAYRAKVIWGEGLSLRSGPGRDSERTGGVGYNEEVIVLESDGEWVKIRTSGEQEGWVRQGNLQKLE